MRRYPNLKHYLRILNQTSSPLETSYVRVEFDWQSPDALRILQGR